MPRGEKPKPKSSEKALKAEKAIIARKWPREAKKKQACAYIQRNDVVGASSRKEVGIMPEQAWRRRSIVAMCPKNIKHPRNLQAYKARPEHFRQ